MYKVLLWGTGWEYDQHIGYIQYEEKKGNIEVIGVTSQEQGIKKFDDYQFIQKKDINHYKVDYVILLCSSKKSINEIKKELESIGINDNQIVPVKVFELPQFDFKLYIKVLENNITIIANNCWGVLTYDSLEMKYNSPFINMLISEDDYLRLLSDFKQYMYQPLIMKKDRDIFGPPIAMLGDVEIILTHYLSFEEGKKCWDRRKQRINYNNLFFQIATQREDVAKRFCSLPLKNKVCFYDKKTDGGKGIVSVQEYNMTPGFSYGMSFQSHMLEMARKDMKFSYISKSYNVLKLLLGEEKFMRKEYL